MGESVRDVQGDVIAPRAGRSPAAPSIDVVRRARADCDESVGGPGVAVGHRPDEPDPTVQGVAPLDHCHEGAPPPSPSRHTETR